MLLFPVLIFFLHRQTIKIKEVPEVILKKRKQRQVLRANEVRAKIKQRAVSPIVHDPPKSLTIPLLLQLKKRQAGHLVFKRAEKFVKERRKKDKDKKRLKRNAKVLLRYMEEKATESDKRLLFVIRLAAYV